MEKKQEIQMLKEFKGTDSYFNEFFSNEDIDQMCENIKSDFPLELGCKFVKKYEEKIANLNSLLAEANKEKDELRELAAKEKAELAKKVIENMDSLDDGAYDAIEEEMGISFIIRTKHAANIELSDDEIDYLVKNLK